MDDKVQELLSLDVDDVVERGKISKRKHRKRTAIITIICIAVVAVGYLPLTYQIGVFLANDQKFDKSYDFFLKLGEYRDSQENLEKLLIAQKFVNSAVYQSENQLRALLLQSNSDALFSYEWKTKTLVVSIKLDNISVSDVKNADSEAVKFYLYLFRQLDKTCKVLKDACAEEGYEVDCRTDIMGSDKKLLASSLNGEETFCCVDY